MFVAEAPLPPPLLDGGGGDWSPLLLLSQPLLVDFAFLFLDDDVELLPLPPLLPRWSPPLSIVDSGRFLLLLLLAVDEFGVVGGGARRAITSSESVGAEALVLRRRMRTVFVEGRLTK